MADTVQSLEGLAALKPAAPEAPVHVQKLDKQGRAYATGKRKNAVARVWLKPGSGKIEVNGRDRPGLRYRVTGALTELKLQISSAKISTFGQRAVDDPGLVGDPADPEDRRVGVVDHRVGRIADKPWVVDGALAVRKVMQLSVAFDHRVCDGGEAGGFLRYVADLVESPPRLLGAL